MPNDFNFKKRVRTLFLSTKPASVSRWFDTETCGATCSPSIPSTPGTTRTGSSSWQTSSQSWDSVFGFSLQSQINPRFNYPFVIRYQPPNQLLTYLVSNLKSIMESIFAFGFNFQSQINPRFNYHPFVIRYQPPNQILKMLS